VDITGYIPEGVLLSAYQGNGTVVVVAVDSISSPVTLPITIAGGNAPGSMTPWVTSAADNLKAKEAVAVGGTTFIAALAGKTVTTFVGR
jgi:O-glycosyl hydrolase